MANSEDDLVSRLAAVVERAAPAVAASAHVTSQELERVRAGEEDAELAASYRHLAACASCRARLAALASSETAIAHQSSSRGPARVVARPRASSHWAWWAAAAVLAIVFGLAVVQRHRVPDRLAIVQRPYSGMMGSQQPAPGTNTNVELSFVADARVSAFLVPCGEGGELLSAPSWFAREDGERAIVSIAPRAFSHGSGKVVAFVVWGTDAPVHAVAARLNSLAPSTSRAVTERHLAELAHALGARVQRVELTDL